MKKKLSVATIAVTSILASGTTAETPIWQLLILLAAALLAFRTFMRGETWN